LIPVKHISGKNHAAAGFEDTAGVGGKIEKSGHDIGPRQKKLKKCLTAAPDGCIYSFRVMDKSRPDFSRQPPRTQTLFLWGSRREYASGLTKKPEERRGKPFCSNAPGCTTPTGFDTCKLQEESWPPARSGCRQASGAYNLPVPPDSSR
jgi:hypothetical protein